MTGNGQQPRIVTFYSYKGGVGRTMALANTAWVLASAGYRVLTVDWDLESPGLRRYFYPFLTDQDLVSSDGIIDMLVGFTHDSGEEPEVRLRYADFDDHVQTLDWRHFPDNGRIDFLGPGRQPDPDHPAEDPHYADNISTFPWQSFFDTRGGQEFIDRLRQNMLSGDYDYVLVDSRNGYSDAAGICTILLPDVVVLGCALNNQAIDGGAEMVAHIMAAPRKIQVLPIPMRVEEGESHKRAKRRRLVALRFREVLRTIVPDDKSHIRWLTEMEIPYKTVYSYEETLAAFEEDSAGPGSLLSAYRNLAQVLTGTTLPPAPEIPFAERHATLDKYDEPESSAPGSVMVFAAARDRAWREWIVHVLVQGGVRVQPTPARPTSASQISAVDSLVVLRSAALTPAVPGESVVRGHIREFIARTRQNAHGARAVLIENGPVDQVYDELPTVNLVEKDEQIARRLLLTHFGAGASVSRGGSAVRFPATVPRVWDGMEERNQWFVGRDDDLDRIRDALIPGGPDAGPCILVGETGFGKTELAREYVHRFAASYDLIWLISAENPTAVRRGLGALASRLPLAVTADGAPSSEENAPGLADSVLDTLRRGDAYRRWLLIYDNAAAPAALAGLLPKTTPFGHVIVTTRNAEWGFRRRLVEVGALPRHDSIALLRKGRPDIPETKLAAVAEAVSDVPFELDAAARALQTTTLPPIEAATNYLDQLTNPSNRPPGSAWSTTFHRLKESPEPINAAAAYFLEICAFLAAEGVGADLVSSPEMISRVRPAADAERAPAEYVDSLLQVIRQTSLAKVDAHGTVVLHDRAQRELRDEMSETGREATRTVVRAILAAFAPPQPMVDIRSRPVYEELQKHIEPSDAASSTDPRVRAWLIRQVYYLWQIGEWTAAIALGQRCREGWSRASGPENAANLKMGSWVGIVLRDAGEYQQAFDLNEQTLRLQRRDPGMFHQDTLLTASSFGADQRVLGRYRDARVESRTTWLAYRRTVGEEARATLNAGSNYALAQLLDGDQAGALQTNRLIFQRRRDTLGVENVATWLSQAHTAVCLRELGNYPEAHRLLNDARTRLLAIEGEHGASALESGQHLAVTLRRRGDPAVARKLVETVIEHYQAGRREDTHNLLGSRVILGMILHTLADHDAAVDHLEDSLGRYRAAFGDGHPVVNACRSNTALCLLGAGRFDEALDCSQTAYESLTTQLYEYHPLTLAAGINQARCLAAVHRDDEAAEILAAVHGESRESLGQDHPLTRAAAAGPDGRTADGIVRNRPAEMIIDMDFMAV